MWSNEDWLPGGYTWSDLEKFSNSSATQSTPHVSDFIQALPLALLFYAARFAVEALVKKSFGKSSKITGEDQHKISECVFLALYFLGITLFATWSLLSVEWRSSYHAMWLDYPFQFVDENVRLLYMVELGRYLSLMVTLGTDRRRTDFTQVVTHHIATIALLTLSYMINFTRFGAVILWYHNISDVFLQSAKAAKIAQFNTMAQTIFCLFAVIFLTSRLYFYPLLVWEGVIRAAPFDSFPVYNIIVAFLCVLALLHLMWSYTIVKILVRSLDGGGVTDIREEQKVK